jgi:hypothetical protein
MKLPAPSPLREQAADALRRARKLPVGSDRNDLRQLAIGLLWLEKRGAEERAAKVLAALKSQEEGRQLRVVSQFENNPD